MPFAQPDPYISLVVTARNDNHGVNMLGRMQAFLDSWIGQAQRLDLPSEIVVVEWNPPTGPRLKESLHWPESTAPCAIRFIEVPPEVHQSIPNPVAIQLHQMIAKNAGIRRARGEFVLATNLDIIFSPQLMQFLASRRLERRAFYRMDRHDVASEIPPHGNLDELLAFCDRNILRVCAREGVWDTDGTTDLRPIEAEDIVAAGGGVRLGEGWYDVETPEGVPHRYFDRGAEIVFDPGGPEPFCAVLDLEAGPSAVEGWTELVVVDSTGEEVTCAIVDSRCRFRLHVPGETKCRLRVRQAGAALLRELRFLNVRAFDIHLEDGAPSGPTWKLERIGRSPGVDWAARGLTPHPHAAIMRNAAYLHTNGCGDFTMMSRQDWFSLRAYPEFPVWPQHIDSFLCYAAHHAGFREVILRTPMRIFHVQHEAASGATPQGEAALKARVAAKGVPMIDYVSLIEDFNFMRRFDAPLIFSGEHWGLADRVLPENTLD